MPKIHEIELKEVIERPEIIDAEEGFAYYSKEEKSLQGRCPCGCEYHFYLPVNRGKKWWEAVVKDSKITVKPSVLNKACGAHYFIRDNKIVWC